MSDLRTNPQEIIDDAVYTQLRQLQAEGKTALDTWTNRALPLNGWSLGTYVELLDKQHPQAGPTVAGMPNPNAGWVDDIKATLRTQEGWESRAYHGAKSSLRTQGKYVQDGHASKEEVSVGYGFNMNRGNGEGLAELQGVLGLPQEDAKAIFNGRRQLAVEEGEKLLDYEVNRLNDWLIQKTGGFPFRDHERKALLSYAYNAGTGSLERSGILDAAKRRDTKEVVARLRAAGTKDTKTNQLRREKEIVWWMGADAQNAYASIK